ncbi:hypothetical protein EVAR_60927_1 [Eumeta japonica]|uniref:Uncharacterized protein n=1 Tax=Eumeta variegata TaxID=151549 RepID=A0A4C1ZK89_EUMVA|nr:hypothetical protein EVAR_60927_1 [Eumeta japonica]
MSTIGKTYYRKRIEALCLSTAHEGTGGGASNKRCALTASTYGHVRRRAREVGRSRPSPRPPSKGVWVRRLTFACYIQDRLITSNEMN